MSERHEYCDGDHCELCVGEFSYTGRMQAVEESWISLAKDYLGAACRDNSRQELIEIGRKIEQGTWE